MANYRVLCQSEYFEWQTTKSILPGKSLLTLRRKKLETFGFFYLCEVIRTSQAIAESCLGRVVYSISRTNHRKKMTLITFLECLNILKYFCTTLFSISVTQVSPVEIWWAVNILPNIIKNQLSVQVFSSSNLEIVDFR